MSHNAALTETENNQSLRVNGVAFQACVEKSLQLLPGCHNRGNIQRAAHTAHRIPGIAYGAWADRGFQRPLGTEHQELAATKVRSEPQEVQGVGPYTMEGQDCRIGSETAGFID